MLLAALILSPFPLGEYFLGNGAGINSTFEFLPENQYRYIFQGCFSHREQRGGFTVANGKLTLNPPVKDEVAGGFSNFFIVRWDNRIYLLSSKDLPDFCVAYRKGWRGADFPTTGRYLRNGSDLNHDRPAPALKCRPQLPAPWNLKLKSP